MTPSTVRLNNLWLSYGATIALEDLTGRIPGGDLLAIVGPNGSGKSSFLKALAGRLRPKSGTITWDVETFVAYMPQVSSIDRTFPISVLEFVATGLLRQVGLFQALSREDRRAVESALTHVSLLDHAGRMLAELSGGQMQRAMFARTALQDAPIILLDEPFNAVDGQTVQELSSMLLDWHRQGRTIVTVLHDLDLARSLFANVLILSRRVIGWGPTSDVLVPENIQAAYKAM